jgi:precorrin-3B methylase
VASYTTDRLGNKAGPFLTADGVERIYATVDPSRGQQLNDAIEIIQEASKSNTPVRPSFIAKN